MGKVTKTVEFKVIDFSHEPRTASPFEGKCPAWTVYGGSNGSIMVYKPEKHIWERLGQTWKNNGYWNVTIRDRFERRRKKRGDEPHRPHFPVHLLMCLAWRGEPEPGRRIGRHLNGNADDNSEGNLDWGSRDDNADDAVRHKEHRANMRIALKPYTFNLVADHRRFTCFVKRYGKLVKSEKGENGHSVMAKAMRFYEQKWFQKKQVHEDRRISYRMPYDGELMDGDLFEKESMYLPSSFIQRLTFDGEPK